MNPFRQRCYVIGGLFCIIFLLYICRLFFLQVVDQSYKMSASNNVLRAVTQYPARGLMYDRNGELLVHNQAAYDLMVTPNQLREFDTTLFCQLLNISKEQVDKRLRKAKRYSYYKSSIFLEQISAEEYGAFQEHMYEFKGFYSQTRSLRIYPHKMAAHLFGYVGEVDDKTAKNDSYYKSGDYIGISGIERMYEEELRGQKGVEIFMVDVHNRIKGQYKDGRYDTLAVNGHDLILTIDAELQQYGEMLMQGKMGSIVAIEPSTGEILAMVSSPTYDPSLLVGRERSANYKQLRADSLNPLFCRPLQSRNPPGSTFKTIEALIGLQEGTINGEYTRYPCHYGYTAGRFHMGCHGHASPLNVVEALQHSCNAFFAADYRRVLDEPKFGSIDTAFTVWRRHVTSFGLGSKLGIDLPYEVSGYVPSLNFYDRTYGKGRLKSLYIVSNSIGQGELLLTPLQIANLCSTIANRGHYFTPHVVKTIVGGDSDIRDKYREPHYTDIDTTYFPTIVEGMYRAVNSPSGGTAAVAAIKGFDVCGKTGTVQNPHGKDHSVFMSFAPRENPQIAIAVYIENAGFGATFAAPIGRLMVERYLTDTITRPWLERRILSADLINGTTR